MNQLFTDYLFSKGYFVSEKNETENQAETVVSLAELFSIEIVAGYDKADVEMIRIASRNLGEHVPRPFYEGFPESVFKMSAIELFLDQLIHYTQTYGWGRFDEPGHPVFEGEIKRKVFGEDVTPKKYKIISKDEAVVIIEEAVNAFLDSTRPLNEDQYNLVFEYVSGDYGYTVSRCGCKDTVIRLLLDTHRIDLASLITLSDVIRLVEQLNHDTYKSDTINKLNLKNQDRKFIIKVLNYIFKNGRCDIINCFEKKKQWAGLLHHIHYRPINKKAEEFVREMRGKDNRSVYSSFEAALQSGDIRKAVKVLESGKGSASVLRNLNYILSRCETSEDVLSVLDAAHTENKIVLIQLLIQYKSYQGTGARTFKFTKFNKMRVHRETAAEIAKRKSAIPEALIPEICENLENNLRTACQGSLAKVYIDEDMKRVALPLQENTSMGGVGVLPKGTRLPIPEGKKIRAFTYWELVDDIDLSVFAILKDGRREEFSWRTMSARQSSAVTFSGDQTSGYYGGSEYFDIDIDKFKELFPDAEYLVFCNNVFSNSRFSKCFCKAGYMLRDKINSGEVYEPKTVSSAFMITCDSRFAYLFGVDLNKREFIWLNVSRDSNLAVAGLSEMDFLLDYMHVTDVINLYNFAEMLATEVVDDPAAADVIFSDKEEIVREGAEVIRSCDFEKVLALMQ